MPWIRLNVASINHLYVVQGDPADIRTVYPATGQRSAGQQSALDDGDLKNVVTEYGFNPTRQSVNSTILGSDWEVSGPGRRRMEWRIVAYVPNSTAALADNLLNLEDSTFLIAHEWGNASDPGPDAFWMAGYGHLLDTPMQFPAAGGITIELNFAGEGSGLWRNNDGR